MIDHIEKSRVRTIPNSLIKSGVSEARLIIPVPENSANLEKYDLEVLEKDGDRIVPKPARLATKRNIEGRIIVHRERPKEPHSWQVLWGREQFCGNGETEWVEDYITRTAMRYPRTHLVPESIELIRCYEYRGFPIFHYGLNSHRE
jgi:hypothetical protein